MIQLPRARNRRKLLAIIGLAFALILMTGFTSAVYVLNSPSLLRRATAWWIGAQYLGTNGVLMQTQANNCGPASLKMIFDHYGIPSTVDGLDTDAELTYKRTSMLTLKEMAEKRGLGAEGWRYTMDDFMHLKMPAIVFVRGDHFAVADSVTSDGFIILSDPAVGKVKIAANNFQRIWKGETLVFKKRSKN